MSLSDGQSLTSLLDSLDASGTEYASLIEFYFMAQYCYSHPHDALCDNFPSYYMYRVSLLANALFVGILILSLVGFVATWQATRRGHAFNTAMILGVVTEILGYAARILSWNNQWEEYPFLMQVCCLTVGPAFMAAAIYFCLRRIVRVFGVSHSRIPPAWYTRLFIPCDLVSLVLQAAGGGMAAVANQRWESTRTGDNVMIAGLGFQVLTMLAFTAVAGDFAIRAWRHGRCVDSGDMIAPIVDRDAVTLGHLRSSWRFRCFLGALAVSTVCIFWRSVFRVVELSGGWNGPLMERQDLFIGFEGVMIVIAVLGLNIFHPGFCSRDLLDDDLDGKKVDKTGVLLDEVPSGSEGKTEAV